jgi:Cu(I)/Ag(I) efflux system membrane protein CusA/SilA
VKGTRSVLAERTGSGYFLDFEWNREALARYGLSIEEAQGVIEKAIGGENVTMTVEGRERYPVNVRYMRDFRANIGALNRVLVPASGGQRQIPLSQLATIKAASGPSMIRDENGMLAGYCFVDISTSDVGGFVSRAKKAVAEKLHLPDYYSLQWSGQYEICCVFIDGSGLLYH